MDSQTDLSNADRRLQDRSLRKGELKAEDLENTVLAAADSADNAERPDDESVAQLREELVVEKVVRDERVERRLSEPPPEPVRVPAVATPLDDEL